LHAGAERDILAVRENSFRLGVPFGGQLAIEAENDNLK
jgi:hypothetical protein